ncbi:hypothetical protein AA313_de0208478 [Arthrobotrys entomopaga]|nr:hypothetical protein AA313_de0208478 [Arthrobotrys entomopaga]
MAVSRGSNGVSETMAVRYVFCAGDEEEEEALDVRLNIKSTVWDNLGGWDCVHAIIAVNANRRISSNNFSASSFSFSFSRLVGFERVWYADARFSNSTCSSDNN